MAMTISSSAFEAGGVIPARYTCDGDDISPPLAWSAVPPGTMSLALIADDPDAPAEAWVHWVLYGLAPDMRELLEAVPTEESVLSHARQGTNDFGRIGYGGPCPPPGAPHRYYFKLYAVDMELELMPGATKNDLLEAMQGHVLGGGQLMGRYERGG